MTRTQIQFPDPLYRRLKATAARRDWTLAELLRRAAEAYLATLPDTEATAAWEMPVLPASGGLLVDPASGPREAESVLDRYRG